MLHEKSNFVLPRSWTEMSVFIVIAAFLYFWKSADAKKCRQKHGTFFVDI